MPTSRPSTEERVGHRHEAMFYRTSDELVAGSLAFVQDALVSDEPVAVALDGHHWSRIRAELGADARRVWYLDMAQVGRNPAHLMPALWAFIDQHRHTGRRLRGLGEPVWPGRRQAELAEALLHEALVAHALPADVSIWLLCPYDERRLPTDALAAAHRIHPNGSAYAGPVCAEDLCREPLPDPGGSAEELLFGPGDLCAVRELVAGQARAARLDASRREDLVLGVNEVAANSLDHAGGHGLLRIWREPGALVCEVQDGGRISDLLAGRRPPDETQERGRGLWLVNQICDLVQIRSGPQGTVVRVHTWLEAGPSGTTATNRA